MSSEDPLRVGLVALFVTSLVVAQVTASKRSPVLAPGRRAATVVVNVGFAMNFVLLGLVWSTILAPSLPAAAQPVDPAAFRSVLVASTGIVAASLAAYVVSQNWDVFVFHSIGEYTDGDHLWLRNIGSTASSQLLDTVIFIGIAFVVVQGVPLSAVLSLAIGQYLLKLAIAVVDTPFVYAIVRFSNGRTETATPAVQ